MNKRGQVTVFIILGIVVLGIIGVVVLVQNNQLDYYLQLEKSRVNVPGEILPAQLFLEGCLQENVERGLKLMGRQAGYLKYETSAYETFDGFANSLQVYSGYNVPYWYYEDLNGKPRDQVPSFSEMENQLNEFIEIGFSSCLDEIQTEFGAQGFEFDVQDKVKSDVTIEKEFVEVVVRAPMEVMLKEVGVSIPRHVVKVDSSYGKLYEQAKQLYDDNNQETWLENRTLSYIYTYTEELPHYDSVFTCKPLIWKTSEIKENYQDILELNVPFYLVEGSEYDSYYDTDESLVWDAGPGFENTKVYFDYDKRWPFDMDISGSEGGLLVSQPFEGGIPVINFCTNFYNFFYDVKHPVLITVEGSDGYEFRFANQVVLRNSEPQRLVDLDEIEHIQYCDIKDGEVDVSVNTADKNGFLGPVENASLYYQCINHICYLGDTDEEGKFEGAAPSCFGGVLEVRAEGYAVMEENLDTFGEVDSLFLDLRKKENLSYEFKVYDKSGDTLTGPRDLRNDENVLLQVENLDTGEIEFVGFYPDEDTTLELSENIYGFTTKLIHDGTVTIESETLERCNCPEIFFTCPCGKETITLEETTVENPVTGGSYVEVLIEDNDLKNNNKIVFYVIREGVPTTYESVTTIYDHQTLSRGFEDRLMPTYRSFAK